VFSKRNLRLMFTIHYLLLTIHYSLLTNHYLRCGPIGTGFDVNFQGDV
jgi:hypothetical protein